MLFCVMWNLIPAVPMTILFINSDRQKNFANLLLPLIC